MQGGLWLAISLGMAAAGVQAEDWPEFRGPTAQGVASAVGLPVTWGPEQHVVWRTEVPGLGWSSPVVVGERVYLTSAVTLGEEKPEADRELCVVALEAATGKVVWRKVVFVQKAANAPKIHQKNSHASPTVVVREERVFAHFGHMGTACLEAESGDVIWATQAHAYAPVHGNGSSPVLVDGLLVFSADAADAPAVVALEAATGKLKWRAARESGAKRKFSFCTPLVIEVAGKKQIVTPGSGVVQGLDLAEGRELWRVNYDQGYSVVPRPVFADGLLYVCTGYDKPSLLAIRVDGAMAGDVTGTHVAWRLDKFMPHNPSLVVADGLLYAVADNGVLTCADARTGEVHYQERCAGPCSASLLHAEGRVYVLDERGQTVVVKAGKVFEVLARNAMEERSLASLAVAGNDLLLRTAAALYRLRKAD